jgi:hypothetical protein
MTKPRHREERSDAAIHLCVKPWIATAFGLAMTGQLLGPSNDGPIAFGLAMTKPRHREERSDVAIHLCMKPWIATAFGLAMTGQLPSASQ